MSCYQSGKTDEAHSQLAQAREIVEEKFQKGLDRGNGITGFWYDWVFARILLREATTLMEQPPQPDISPAVQSAK